jgi:uncharacterized protein (TIGR03437 family)
LQTGTAPLIAVAPNGSIVLAEPTSVISIFPALTLQNAASLTANPIAPGEIVAIRGYGIGPATGVVPPGLTGVEVSFDGFAAPLFYAQDQQVNAQVPWEIAGKTSTLVRVAYTGPSGSTGISTTPVAVAPAAPGIFYINNSDGTQNSPSNPATAGDFVSIYGTAGGLSNPVAVTGALWSSTMPLPNLTQPVTVSIGGENASVLYAGASPLNSSGFFQVNVRLPTDLTPAAQFLSIAIGGVTSARSGISVK